ncbi:MAG: hypothetical protein KJ607_04455 [Bacteroidetes bacterium]|nr:hypothetical protein [Bacteroidota bacterium]
MNDNRTIFFLHDIMSTFAHTFKIIILSGFVCLLVYSCKKIEDLPRDNPLDGNLGTGTAELYISRDAGSACDLYVKGVKKYTFKSRYEGVFSRQCGFDSVYSGVFLYENSPGIYDYIIRTQYNLLDTLHSGTFSVKENECNAIDLWPDVK